MGRKFESDYRINLIANIVETENKFRHDVDLRLTSLEGQFGVIDRAAAEARDRVIAYAAQEISPRAAQLVAIIAEYASTTNPIISTIRGGVDARGDTLAKILAITDLLAPAASPTLTGTPLAPTAAPGANTTQIATTAFVTAAINALLDGAPVALDTLKELATALSNDANFAASMTTALGARVRVDAAQGLTDAQKLQGRSNLYAAPANGVFYKKDVLSSVFTKTGAGTISIKAGAIIDAAGAVLTWAVDTAVTMPALTAGTDYAIYACADGSLVASSSFTAPAGYTTANSRQIGGFHYAPGGNAAARAGGNTTPTINEYSLWDLKWRPRCLDPRGMTLIAGGFWCDIYLLGVDHQINGTSKNGVTIADGASPPKLPAVFGGNGSTTYSTLNWWEAQEVLRAYGKRPLTYDEFAAAAYGTTEAVSRNSVDAGTTGLNTSNANQDERFTSKWGVIQSSGVMWIWGANFGGGAAGAGWTANTGGRGSTYQMENAALFGGDWDRGSYCGSRASDWNHSPTYSYSGVGARGCCDHLILV